ncbi:MAG: DUF302 domain-containing protein [Candidatus Delongbacteria bacterium]|nr:DUF302 domain-containing protein [Candidatus Delongbacteria bacterium]
MYYIVDTEKSFEQAAADLEEAVALHKFGVLHIHDLGATLRSKGVEFDEQCRIFEVCNPVMAARVMSADMRLNMALPCRISVYTDKSQTRIGLIKPEQMLAMLSQDPELVKTAGEVEAETIKIIDDAR